MLLQCHLPFQGRAIIKKTNVQTSQSQFQQQGQMLCCKSYAKRWGEGSDPEAPFHLSMKIDVFRYLAHIISFSLGFSLMNTNILFFKKTVGFSFEK